MLMRDALNVKLHLRGGALIRAKLAMLQRGQFILNVFERIRYALQYTGPEFQHDPQCLIKVAVGASTVNVLCIDIEMGIRTEYVYPLSSVGRCRIVEL